MKMLRLVPYQRKSGKLNSMESAPFQNDRYIRQMIFDTLEDGGKPLAYFFPKVKFESLNMPQCNGVAEADIQRVVLSSLNEGLIANVDSDLWQEGYFRITASGVKVWATLADPSWDRFWDGSSDTESTTLTAVRKATLTHLITMWPWPLVGEPTLTEIGPFEPRPGVTFSSGWEATFGTLSFEPVDSTAVMKFSENNRWYRRAREDPSWPFSTSKYSSR